MEPHKQTALNGNEKTPLAQGCGILGASPVEGSISTDGGLTFLTSVQVETPMRNPTTRPRAFAIPSRDAQC
jgi:hypothetical protein